MMIHPTDYQTTHCPANNETTTTATAREVRTRVASTPTVVFLPQTDITSDVVMLMGRAVVGTGGGAAVGRKKGFKTWFHSVLYNARTIDN